MDLYRTVHNSFLLRNSRKYFGVLCHIHMSPYADLCEHLHIQPGRGGLSGHPCVSSPHHDGWRHRNVVPWGNHVQNCPVSTDNLRDRLSAYIVGHSVERYFAICKPWTRRLSKRFILRVIVCIWLIGVSVSIPDLIFYSVTPTFHESITFYLRYCSRQWKSNDNLIYNLVILIVLYSIPICLMAYTYAIISKQLWRKDLPGIVEAAEHRPMNKITSSGPESQLRSRQRAAKMLIAIVVVFAVCYLPVYVLNLTRITASFQEIPANWISIIVLTSHILCYANSVVNPFIYNFMSAKFRKEFQAVLRLSRCRCSSRKIRIPSVLTSSKNKSSLPRTEGYELNIDNSKQSWIKSSTKRKEQNPQEKYGWNMMKTTQIFLWSGLIGCGVQR